MTVLTRLLVLLFLLTAGGAAAQSQVPISGLPNGTTPLAGTEVLPVVQSGTTVKVPVSGLGLQGQITPMNYGAAGNDVTNDSTAINSAAAALSAACTPPLTSTSNCQALTIDRPYAVTSSIFLESSYLTVKCIPGVGRIDVKGGSYTGNNAVIMPQTLSMTSPVINNRIQDCLVQGDSTYVHGGNVISFNSQYSSYANITVNYFCAGRAMAVAGWNLQFYNLVTLNPCNSVGAGGLRIVAGHDIDIFGATINSGDDACQLVPPETGFAAGIDIVRVHIWGCQGQSLQARSMVMGLGGGMHPKGEVSMSASILDSSICGSGGANGLNRPALITNYNSSGKVDRVLICDARFDSTNDQRFLQGVLIQAWSPQTPIGTVTLRDITVVNPYGPAFAVLPGAAQQLPTTQRVDVQNSVFGRPTYALLTGISQNQNIGDTSVILTPAVTALFVTAGDPVAISCPLSGSPYAGQIFPTTVVSVSGATINLDPTKPFPCAPIAGSAFYDYQFVAQFESQTAGVGTNTIYVPSLAGWSNGDNVRVAYDDGTIGNFTVNGSGSPTTCTNFGGCFAIPLNANLAKQVSAGNFVADLSTISVQNTVQVRSTQGGSLSNSILYGSGSDVLSMGGTTLLSSNVSNFAIDGDTFIDISNNHEAVNLNRCAGCPMRNLAFQASPGQTSWTAVRWNNTVNASTTTLSGSMNNSQTTIPFQTSSDFPFTSAYYIGVTTSAVTEYMEVTSGFNGATASPTVLRGLLGSTAAPHNSGDTVTIAQAEVTDSPLIGADVGVNTAQDCSTLFSPGAAGMGNQITNLKGCDWRAYKVPSTAAMAYNDIWPMWRLTGNTDIMSLSFLTGAPPHYGYCWPIYNSGAGTINIWGGSGFVNANSSFLSNTLTGNTHTTANVDSIVSDVRLSGWLTGMSITDLTNPDIPANTTIKYIASSGTRITLSQFAVGSHNGDTLSVTGGPNALTMKSITQYCFDPITQVARQSAATAQN